VVLLYVLYCDVIVIICILCQYQLSDDQTDYQFPICNTKWLKNGKLRKAILSAFYNISQRNFGILLILWCSFLDQTCLDQNFTQKGKGLLSSNVPWCALLNYFTLSKTVKGDDFTYLRGECNLIPRACDPREGTWGSGIIRFREESDWPLKWNAGSGNEIGESAAT
jgi:hypothetical protein